MAIANRKVIAKMPLDSHNPIQQPLQALPLTPREHDVLRELAQGNSNKTIAKTLSISTYTVDGYVKDIFRKLGVRNRSMAAVVAFHHGMLEMTSPARIASRNEARA
ncbi:LuxR C-terminal-related transcriptional regulator [Zhongshania sp.]|uniref:response regulator transcription factor n=1 Tax=Zhongshania sp. TaxID=1971902 RepID=UPI001B752F67|nr:LuxR C-terminal-related transcriptional regulator [Zhongshania sp.]MBQ0794728.1 response regulator transcription factor [Zhongshania sp.]